MVYGVRCKGKEMRIRRPAFKLYTLNYNYLTGISCNPQPVIVAI